MFVIAVTGRLASGKSTVSRLLAARGGFLIDADEIANEALKKDKPQYSQVLHHFGEDILDGNKEIHRKLLAEKVFSSNENLERLEAVIHPFVRDEIRKKIASVQEDNWKFIVIDLPLVEKSGLREKIDYIIFVRADEEKMIQRATAEGLDYNDAVQRLRRQPSVEELEKLADVLIENSNSLDFLRQQVDELFNQKLNKLIKK